MSPWPTGTSGAHDVQTSKHTGRRVAWMRRRARPNALRPGKLRGSTDMTEEKMAKLDGKIAVITGGNSGIGLATAKVFVKKGARVYITGRRKPELEAAAGLLGPNATPVQGDVTKPADLDRLYGQIRKEVGRAARPRRRFRKCRRGHQGAT